MSRGVHQSISQGSLRATADAIEQMFGADEDPDALDLFDLEGEFDELYGADEDLDFDLALLDDDDDEEVSGVDPMEPWALLESGEPKTILGRREMANRARAHFRGNGGSGDSFRAGVMYGYMQSLFDSGMPEGALPDDTYGLFKRFKPFKGVKGLVGAATKGLLGGATATTAAGELGRGLAVGLVGQPEGMPPGTLPVLTPSPPAGSTSAGVTASPLPVSTMAHQLGHRMGSGLGVVGGGMPSASAPVEAEKQTLPPVYVADKMGFEADADLIEGRSTVLRGGRADLSVEDRFGATALVGLVNGQTRRSARHAARDAAKHGATVLALSPRTSSGAPFVEDPGANPVLFGDGRIFDSIYGELVALPCPSCAPVSEREAFAGVGRSCIVCDGHGAFLTPASDVSEWSGGVRYGIFPLLIPLVTAGAAAATPILTEGGKGFLSSRRAQKAADLADREQAILARLKKKAETVSAEVKAPGPAKVSAPEAAAASIPPVVPTSAPEISAEVISGLFDDDDEDDDFGFAVLGDEVDDASVEVLLEDDDDASELQGEIDAVFGISEDEFDALMEDDDDEDGFGGEDASSERLIDHVHCVRALVPSSYLRDVQPRDGVK